MPLVRQELVELLPAHPALYGHIRILDVELDDLVHPREVKRDSAEGLWAQYGLSASSRAMGEPDLMLTAVMCPSRLVPPDHGFKRGKARKGQKVGGLVGKGRGEHAR